MKQNFTVRQGALDGVEAFLSVAQHRSFRRAAAELGVTPSAMSQAVRALEARIGAALFIRTTRSVGLTEAGDRFLSRAKPAFEELVAASAVAHDLGQRPTGLLRLSVPHAMVPILLERLIASFCQVYPEVKVEIAASKELIDVAAEGFDPARTWMIGNSPKSDIGPALAAGLGAVFIPNVNTWAMEHDEVDERAERLLQLDRFADLLEHF